MRHRNSFNRTIVELKLGEDMLLKKQPYSPFNRTIVELKRSITAARTGARLAFNRTIVELKRNRQIKRGVEA